MILNFHSMDMETMLYALATIVVVFSGTIWYILRKEKEAFISKLNDEEKIEENELSEEEVAEVKTAKTKPKRPDETKNKGRDNFTHPWLAATLKGHTAAVTGISFVPGGKKLVSVSVDRNVFLWNVGDFLSKEHKSSRQILDFDTATKVACASDSKSVIFSMKRDNKLVVYKWTKNNENGALKLTKAETVDFPVCHQQDIKWIGIASSGKFLISASGDNVITIYDIRGAILKKLEPKVSSVYDCSISPDGRFISVCGFTPDVFVYEPIFKGDVGFQDCKKVFDLKGHSSGVLACSFNSNSTRAITVSRDGCWRVFDTEIRYNQGQDASLLITGEWNLLKGATADQVRLAVSPSGGSFAVSFGSTVKMFSSEDEKKSFPEVTNVHQSTIEEMAFSSCGSFLATCSDRYIRIFHNVPEHHSTVIRLTKNLSEITGDGPRRRASEQIDEAKKKLSEFNS